MCEHYCKFKSKQKSAGGFAVFSLMGDANGGNLQEITFNYKPSKMYNETPGNK